MLEAIIFDFDGVIADDEPLHLQAFREVLAAEKVKVSDAAYYERYLGLDDRGAIAQILTDAGIEASEERISLLAAQKAAAYGRLVAQGVRLFPGVGEFVREASRAVPLAIASGALREEITAILEGAGLAACFATIVSAEDVIHGKPDPEAFLLAARRLAEVRPEISPQGCLVIEDSIAGVEAARRAGMHCVAVTNSYPASALGGADLVIASLEELRLERARQLLGN